MKQRGGPSRKPEGKPDQGSLAEGVARWRVPQASNHVIWYDMI